MPLNAADAEQRIDFRPVCGCDRCTDAAVFGHKTLADTENYPVVAEIEAQDVGLLARLSLSH